MELILNDIPEEVRAVKQRYGIVGNSSLLIEALSRAIRVAPLTSLSSLRVKAEP